jgi:murein L,D-transpeptidase YafK
MKTRLVATSIFIVISFLFVNITIAQNAISTAAKPVYKTAGVLSRMEDSIKKQFERQKLVWPPHSIYIRSFKYDKQMELWVRGSATEPFKLFKTYKVCMQSGTTGPKRMEGDYQVPEGFYQINEFNPNSNYHLSLGLNYPNASDRILSDSVRPGSAIYIHGNCVSTGCIAISDVPIEEVYVIASNAKLQGQEFIPVHVFPVRYNVKKSLEYLQQAIKDNAYLQQFNKSIREVFEYFELKRSLPVILVNKKGEYVVN